MKYSVSKHTAKPTQSPREPQKAIDHTVMFSWTGAKAIYSLPEGKIIFGLQT